jgi:hypothetical protein
MAAVPPAAVPPPFALAPALANAGLLNYANEGDKKIYNKATAPLSEEMYDLSPSDLTTFLTDVDNRTVEYGLEAIISIPEDVNAPVRTLRLLTTEYGQITLNQVLEHVNSYINLQDRDVQNSFILYNCLWNSLTVSAKKKINLQRNKFIVNGTGVGSLLLKVIIQTAYVDTRSTTMQLRTNLASLDDYIHDIKSDIDVFNDYVRSNLDGLAARGEQSLDVVTNLFKGYEAATDSQFLDFVKRKKDAYQEDAIDLTPEDLMTQASNKYNSLKRANQWNKATADQEKIIALETQVAQLKKQRAQKKNKSDKQSTDQEKKNEDKKNPTWLRTPPKQNEGLTRRFKNRTYYWCANHKRWSLNPKHTTETCMGINVSKDLGTDAKHQDKEQQKSDIEPAIKLAKALTSISKQE